MQSLSALGSAVGHLLKERRQTLAVAESAAGGLINAALVAVPGASACYLGGGVIYTGASRSALLGITAQDMANLRSAIEPYAKLLAQRVRINLGATWGLSETGASGPTGNRYGDAPGHACIAVSGPVEAAITVETGSSEREANMWAFARRALELLESCLLSIRCQRRPGGKRHRDEVRQARVGHLLLLGRQPRIESLRGLRDVLERGEAVARRVDDAVDSLQQAKLRGA